MKNILLFYYNLVIDEIHKKDDYYFFNINNNHFKLLKTEYSIDKIKGIYDLNRYLNSYVLIDQIVTNKFNEAYTIIDNSAYILINIKRKSHLSLIEISNLSNININEVNVLERNNWEILWENKIDYYELQVKENAKKYPLIRESFDYFIGLSENAISYLVNTKLETKKTILDNKVISHIDITKSLYNPLNIILDHKSRDLSEYIKLSFFNSNYEIFNELDNYFKYNKYSFYGMRVLFARILYPSFYFNLYDDIMEVEWLRTK